MKYFCWVLFLAGACIGRAAENDEIDADRADAVYALLDLLTRTSDSAAFCMGRLTLTSGTAVTTGNVTAAGTVYFTPYNGNRISLYSGTQWQLISFSETSVSVPATTTTPFDVFAYNNSGTLALETVNWTNDTTRATGLTTQNGILVKSGAATRRYLGTGRTTGSSGQTEDSASKRFLWNACNRVPRKLLAQSSTDSWSYNTTTWRPAGNVTTTGVTRVEFVVGQSVESASFLTAVGSVANTTGTVTHPMGIGINSTSTNSADLYGTNGSTVVTAGSYARYVYIPSVGYSYAQWLERGSATTTTTLYTYLADKRQGGLIGEIWQ